MLRSPSPTGLGAPHRRSPRRALLFSYAAAASGSGQSLRYPWLAWLAGLAIPSTLDLEGVRWGGQEMGGLGGGAERRIIHAVREYGFLAVLRTAVSYKI